MCKQKQYIHKTRYYWDIKKNGLLKHYPTQINLEIIMISERIQPQNNIHYMISFTCTEQKNLKRQTKQISGYLKLGQNGKIGRQQLKGVSFFFLFKVIKCSKIDYDDDLQIFLNILKTIKLYFKWMSYVVCELYTYKDIKINYH